MICNTSLWLPNDKDPLPVLDLIHTKLIGSEYRQDERGVVVYGKRKNLKIWANESGISIKGSLTTYFHNNNIQNLGINDIPVVIANLSDFFELPIDDSEVKSVEVGFTFPTKFKPARYYPFLGIYPFYNKGMISNTMYWESKNQKHKIKIYDKYRESKAKRVRIPNEFIGMHLMRIESTYKKSYLDRILKREIYAKDLWNPIVFNSLLNQWAFDFRSIRPNNSYIPNIDNIKKNSDFHKEIEIFGLSQLGEETVLESIEKLRESKCLAGPPSYSKLKSEVRRLFDSSNKQCTDNQYLTELNQIVAQLQSENISIIGH